MLVYEFMIPAQKVVKVEPDDTIGDALDKLLEFHISAVVVTANDGKEAIGIITKTDISKAYKQGLSLDTPAARIMTSNPKCVKKNLQRDKAASVFAEHRYVRYFLSITLYIFMLILSFPFVT